MFAVASVLSLGALMFVQRIRSAVRENALVSYSDSEEEDADSDEEAERILAEHRARREAAAQAEKAQRDAEEEARRANPLIEMQPGWGAAARAMALRRAMERQQSHAATKLATIAEAARQAAQANSASTKVLTDLDFVTLLHEWREAEYLGDVPTEYELQRFTKCASVCRTWYDAIRPMVLRRVVLRHAFMYVAAPRMPRDFKRPSFLEVTPTDELIICDNHKLSVLPVPTLADVEKQASLAGATDTRIIGKEDGSGGTNPGEFYHPHGLALSIDNKTIFVADRSNHRVQALRLSDGSPLDSTLPGCVWGPYDLALHNTRTGALQLYVVDSNNDRVLKLNARRLTDEPLGSFGVSGSLPGELDRPRGISIAGGEVVVAEMGNNRVSVWTHEGECVRTFGDQPSANGALPLRQPFGVLHAHSLLLVTEHAGGGGSSRLCVFTPQGIPLQILAPPECGGLGGLATDGDWIYALDSQKGHVLAFTAKAPAALGSPAALAAAAVAIESAAARKEAASKAKEAKVVPQPAPPTEWRNPAGPVAHFLRPSLAAIRQRFREGHVVSEEELDAINEENVSNAAAAKAVVESLRRRREAGEVLTAAEDSQIEQADVEQRRIAVLAEGLANSLLLSSEARVLAGGGRNFDPFGRNG